MKHTTPARIPPLRTAAMRAHEGDLRYFAEHPGALWRVRRKAAGEFIDDMGHDSQPHATHLVVLTDKARSHWAGRPLALPADMTDAEIEAAGMAAIVALMEASA